MISAANLCCTRCNGVRTFYKMPGHYLRKYQCWTCGSFTAKEEEMGMIIPELSHHEVFWSTQQIPTKGINQGETMRNASPSAIAPAQEKAAQELVAKVTELLSKNPRMISYSNEMSDAYSRNGGRGYLATVDRINITIEDETMINIIITSPEA